MTALSKHRRATVIFFRCALILIIVGAGVGLSLIRADMWKSGKDWEIWLIWGLAGATCFDQVVKLVKEYRKPALSNKMDDINDALVQLLSVVSSDVELDWRSIGVHAFHLKGWSRWQRMIRIKRVRVNAHPGPMNIKWTKGKGVVGACWAEEDACFHNFRPMSPGGQEPSEADFDGLEDKRDLIYDEYRRLARNFAEVGAWPILDERFGGSDLLGCVVIDVPHGADKAGHPPEKSLLNVDAVSQTARASAALIGRILIAR